jgi:hypothetical protein
MVKIKLKTRAVDVIKKKSLTLVNRFPWNGVNFHNSISYGNSYYKKAASPL